MKNGSLLDKITISIVCSSHNNRAADISVSDILLDISINQKFGVLAEKAFFFLKPSQDCQNVVRREEYFFRLLKD